MQAIRTRFYPATNTRGARVQAKCAAKTIYINHNYDYNIECNHKAACEALMIAMKWDTAPHTPMIGGEFGDSAYWVFTNDANPDKSRSPTTFDRVQS